jgi:hypothetical protein
MAVLKANVVCKALFIAVEGAQTPPKMLTHFHRAWADSRMQFNVLRDQRLTGRLEESEAPGTEINSQVEHS